MLKVSIPTRCENSPKKKLIVDFNRYFGEGDIQALSHFLDEKVIWQLIGKQTVKGKENVIQLMDEMKGVEVNELILESVITHGKEAATNGTMIMANGDQYAFADIYEFTSATGNLLQKITSYTIKTN